MTKVGDTVYRQKDDKEFIVTKISTAKDMTFITVKEQESEKETTYGKKAFYQIYREK